MNRDRPLVIKRVPPAAGHARHGGAWKVAYADFVTAMMAFFLLLWLLSTSSEDTLKGLAEYFSEAVIQNGPPGGVDGILAGMSVRPSPFAPSSMPAGPEQRLRLRTERQPEATLGLAGVPLTAHDEAMDDESFERERERRERESFEAARAALFDALERSPDLGRFRDSLLVDQTPEGLRIQILDRDQYAMFPVGSDEMYPHTRELLELVVRSIANLPNRLSIRGHTDALPFAPGAEYDNWRLSTDRANATRSAMLAAGLASPRVVEVVGRADADPLFAEAPQDPRNRRISLVLLHERPPPAAAP
ncbi:flagellar motor protein MotB [Geminicoccaceae bacterium 1502E]|nr:flagellar motor protein MotB [Geminicoccaceae bacterium 1502E]